jgi:hypothetical protein
MYAVGLKILGVPTKLILRKNLFLASHTSGFPVKHSSFRAFKNDNSTVRRSDRNANIVFKTVRVNKCSLVDFVEEIEVNNKSSPMSFVPLNQNFLTIFLLRFDSTIPISGERND